MSASFKETHADVAWRRIGGMRNVLIHHYFGVRLETVWDVVESELPELRAAVTRILDS